jgi:hypothetical protein
MREPVIPVWLQVEQKLEQWQKRFLAKNIGSKTIFSRFRQLNIILRHIISAISLREIGEMMCLKKYNSARSAMKRLIINP